MVSCDDPAIAVFPADFYPCDVNAIRKRCEIKLTGGPKKLKFDSKNTSNCGAFQWATVLKPNVKMIKSSDWEIMNSY